MQPGGKTSLVVLGIAASAATAGLIFGYDVAVINGALVFLQTGFNLGPAQTGLIPTVMLLGCAAGAAGAGWVSDRYGRRKALFAAAALFCIASFAAASATHLAQLLVARMLAGIAAGSASVIAPLYIAEIAPARLRGRLVTLNQLAIVSGILAGFIINYELARLGPANWRWMFAVGAAPALALCVSLLWIPESPRWLLQRGRRENAVAVLRQTLSPAEVDRALFEFSAAMNEDRGTYRELFGPALRKPLVLTVMLAIIQQVTGINTVMYYGAIIFAQHAGASASQAIGMNVLVGVVNLAFTILGLLLIDKLGRRPLLLTAAGGMAVCLLAFAALLHASAHFSAVVLLLPILGYVAFFAFGLGTGVWVCLAELFPNRIRGRAMSIATMVLWISVSCVTATFLTLIRILGASGVFLGYALLCVLSFAYIYFRLPETKNRTLEEIETFWLRQGPESSRPAQ